MQKALFAGITGMGIVVGSAALSDGLTLHIDTVQATGTVRAAIFETAARFEANQPLKGVSVPAEAGGTTLMFPMLSAGNYGIALYHDLNGNEALDRNLLGAPREPFGFSNNPKIGFSAPDFTAFEFTFDGNSAEFDIKLNGNP
jgi:uncharacterized protein (DUF2141 family)